MRTRSLARLHAAALALSTAAGIAGCGGQKVDTRIPQRPPVLATGCTECHGTSNIGNSAPPHTSTGQTATSDPGVGAHDAHVLPGLLRKAMACDECHPTPNSSGAPGHDNGVVDVVFGSLARSGTASPVWNRTATATAPALSCSATYCHGGTLHDGTNRQPVWTEVGTGQTACGTCHAIPPTWSGHPDVTLLAGYDAARPTVSCNLCHPSTVDAQGQVDTASGHHIDGVLQIGAQACTQCHGDATRTPPEIAPAPPGQKAPFTFADGAHTAHLRQTNLAATPVACSECHARHLSMAGHPANGPAGPKAPAQMTWGPLASAGGSVPSLVRGGASPNCSTTYCHGGTLAGGTNTAPAWDGGPAAVACGTCHGNPPTMAPAGPHPDITREAGYTAANPELACYNCHPGTVDNAGKLLASGGFHMNGYVDLFTDSGTPPQPRTCTTCHGDPAKPVVIHAAPPKSVGGSAEPTDRGVGAHTAHLKLDGRTYSAPISCNQCHPTVTDTDHAARGATVNGHRVDLVFGPLANNLGVSHPTWNGGPRYDTAGNRLGCGPTGGDCTCSAVYCHGDGLTGGSNTRPSWVVDSAQTLSCDSCHGIPPPSPHVARPDCGTCHAGFTNSTVNLTTHVNGVVDATATACTACHGDANRTPAAAASAPPVDTTGNTLTSARGVGAHERHLVEGLLRRAMACRECHVVPTVMDHADGKVDVQFGSLSRTSGAVPAWNPGNLTCSSVYCHGATLGGGTGKTPIWTQVDGTFTRCGNCHGNPPPAPHVQSDLCGGCHPGFTKTTVNLNTHINGTVQTDTACTNCHGTAGRTPLASAAAPPADLHKGTATTLRGVGAHQAHLTAGPVARALACSECHTVPVDVKNHPNNALVVTFGPLARGSGAAPVWNGTGTNPTLSCSATYCHGATLTGGTLTAPVWTKVDGTQAACGACHGVPPNTADHLAGGVLVTTCDACHGAGFSPTAVTGAALALHVDGKIDANGACTSCHGDAANPVTAAASAPPLALATSGADRTSTSVRGVGAHQAHLRGSATAPPVACSECHAVPASSGVVGLHRNSTTEVTFGPLSKTGGVTPVWNGTIAAPTCSATYCHGATMTGGTGTAPVWTTVNGSFKACNSCHGMPGTATAPTGHPTSNGTDCASCHAGYTSTTVDVTIHIDGKTDATGGSCSSCHGTETRVAVTGADPQFASAPPKDHLGNTAVTVRGVGAHIAHVNKSTGAMGPPIACSECHAVPATVSSPGHNNGTTEVVFGPLAKKATAATPTTPAAGTVTPNPTYAQTGALTCSATYCHGNYSSPSHPNGRTTASTAWTATGGLSCTACHAVPTDSCHPPRFDHDGGNNCSDCHEHVNAAGTALTNAKLHVNGVVNGRCTDCHRNAAAGSSKNRTCTP